MKLQILPTTIDENNCVTAQQHLSCLIVDDCIAIDAGSLAMSASSTQKECVRDIVLTHAHLDHIAGLPIFIDDLFANLESPVCVHATRDVIEAIEKHIFNWLIYPRFSELKNKFGNVLVYRELDKTKPFRVKHLNFRTVEVNHKVPSVGFIFDDTVTKIAMSGDTSEMKNFWEIVNNEKGINALLIECAFPNELESLAHSSHHLTPMTLKTELLKFRQPGCPIFVTNIKPTYRQKVLEELSDLAIPNLAILEIGKIYEF